MRALVFGLSGQVGLALQPRLHERQAEVVAVSRQARPPQAGVEWLEGYLQAMPPVPDGIDTVLSLGPLDAFAAWFAGSGLRGVRVIALGSTSRYSKADSPLEAERGLAQRLIEAEAVLFAAGERLASPVTVLRPTLIYGNGRDRSLTPLLHFARRWHWLALPAEANGLRQPVHVEDVAGAVLGCLDTPGTAGQAFDLPGAEVLGFAAMLDRSLQRHAPGCRVLRLPNAMFRAAFAAVSLVRPGIPGAGFLARLQRDQLADPRPASRAFGYAPRPFEP